jgi:hypothetical protein
METLSASDDPQKQIERRDKFIETLVDEIKDNQELILAMNKRVVYLTTLLLAINESETAKDMWEELRMVLALTVPDRLELNTKLKYAEPKEVLKFIDDEDLK